MELIGVSERRYIDGTTRLSILFLKEDNTEFDLPATLDQVQAVLTEVETRKPPPSRRAARAQAPKRSNVADHQEEEHEEVEDEDLPRIRLAKYDGPAQEDDDL